jgi:hypothetical protein
MGFKKTRFTSRILSADPRQRYRDVHVFLGGTGAVGGTALFKTLSIYEEMMAVHKPEPDEVPVLVATGRTPLETKNFTTRLYRFTEAQHGRSFLPNRVGAGHLTHSGIFIVPMLFELSALPRLSASIASVDAGSRGKSLDELPDEASRRSAVSAYLRSIGSNADASIEDIVRALAADVSSARPMTAFLEQYRDLHLGDRPTTFRYRSVINSIPLPSFLSYPREIDTAVAYMPGVTAEHVARLKELLVEAIRSDVAHIQSNLSDGVIIAHTTSVGGMYDEFPGGDEEPIRQIRLGFAHSAKDEALVKKQHFAERLTKEYSSIGVKTLITAAAIGIDEVRIRQTVPLHPEFKRQLQRAVIEKHEPYDESVRMPVVAVLQPKTIPLDGAPSDPVRFDRRRVADDLRPSCTVRSGENGIFSVANAEALYRVMRVASTGELGLTLATVALFGDDKLSPWFPDNVCYYTETDNSRQIFDFLAQPLMRESQLSGLDPLALQDLGSAKHQCELHTLGLLILLHRLKTLDVDALPPYVDVEQFDARTFFTSHSRALTLDDVDTWDLASVARDLITLCAADTPSELETLAPFRPHGHDLMFPEKLKAREKILALVLRAVWAVPSLGTPIVFERDGETFIRCGPFVAPIETVLRTGSTIEEWLRQHQTGSPTVSRDAYRDFHFCNGGFLDIRPRAIVCTAKNDRVDLSKHIKYATTDAELRQALAEVEPYGYFTTCGLLAVLFRLKALYSTFEEADLQLGTLQDSQWQMPRDSHGHLLLVPGIAEAMRMVSEGLEKTTGTEQIDGHWGYERRVVPDRRAHIPMG